MRRAHACVLTLAAVALLVAAPSTASAGPRGDDFYRYHGATALADLSPGAVLATRTVPYHLFNLATPIVATQVLYRSADAQGRPTANVTSVLRPPNAQPGRVVAYGSAYDSLDPADSPSRVIAGDARLVKSTTSGRPAPGGGLMVNAEAQVLTRLLASGLTVVVADTQGPTADFAAGPEYGTMTLDSLRAVSQVASTGVSRTARIALLGYSGGAIATSWAAILAPTYAPDINNRLVGAAQGGVLVDPSRGLRYIDGSARWAGIAGMALVGLVRAYDIDIDKYLNPRGRTIMAGLKNASIVDVLGTYPGLRFADLVKPQYADRNSIREFVDVSNKLNMGTAPIPTIPMLIGQGSNGALEGTAPGPVGIGRGDGVMVAGDVRALAQRYCAAELRIRYNEYPRLSHTSTATEFLPGAIRWITDRFNSIAAPSSCGRIPAGNSLGPQRYVPPSVERR